VARPTAYLGDLARTERHAARSVAEAGWLVGFTHGHELFPPQPQLRRVVCGERHEEEEMNLNFNMRWAEALKRKLLGNQLKMDRVGENVYATYDMMEVKFINNKLSFAMLQNGEPIIESSAVPITLEPNQSFSVRLDGLEGRVVMLAG
jgi:hypothetical protein